MKPHTKILAVLLLALAVTAQGALTTNLVKLTVGSADTLPLAMSKINTNLTGLSRQVDNVPADFDLKSRTNAPDVAPVNSQQLKGLKAKIYNGSKITLAFLGDSVGQDAQPAVESALLPWMGRAGAVHSSNPWYLGNYFYWGASGTRTDYPVGLDGVFWGAFSACGNGAVLTLASTISNGVSGDSLGLAWLQSSGFGSMLVETQQTTLNTWGTLATLSSSGGAGLAMATTNWSVPFANDYLMRVTMTGSNIPLSFAVRDTRAGRGFISSATTTPGNPPLTFMRNAGSNNVAKYLLWQNPDVIFYKAERGASDTNDLPWFDTLLTNTLPAAELVLIAHHQSYNAVDSSGVRGLFLDKARERARAFVDNWAESQPYSNSVARGLYNPDGVHLENVGRAVLHSRLPSQLGLGASEMAVLCKTWPGGGSFTQTNDTTKASLTGNNTFSGVNTFNDFVNFYSDASARAGRKFGVWNAANDQQTIYWRAGNHLVWQDSVASYATVMSLTNNSGTYMFDLPFGNTPKIFAANRADVYTRTLSVTNLDLRTPTGTPGNTTTPVNYITVTNGGVRYYIPAFQ